MTIHVCIGSACHLKGSYTVIDKLQALIKRDGLKDRIEIKGAFCLGYCTRAVSVRIGDGDVEGLGVEDVEAFYEKAKAGLAVEP